MQIIFENKIASKFIFGLLILFIFWGCNTTSELSKNNQVSSFSLEEINMIHKGLPSEPMRVYKINNLQDSLLLRKKCKDVSFDSDSEVLATFVKRLHATVIDPASAGVGIAAPQVGILKNIIWVQRFDKEGFPWEVFINPVIEKYSKKKQPCPEGCLSIPNKNAITQNRAYAILLKYQTITGEEKIEMVEDFTAVIFQHEIDHLDGILFIDHLEAETDN